MPTYEFMYLKCEKPFTVFVSISKYEKDDFRFPECKSKKVKQQITPFQTKTSTSLSFSNFSGNLVLTLETPE